MNQQHLLQALKHHFGYSEFRFHQHAAVTRCLSGQNTVVVMPTGGGKSLCYQLPAVLMEGLTLVISPLIALMQDQVMALKSNGIAAEALNSQCSDEEEASIREAAASGALKLLYVSPERALTGGFLNWIQRQQVALIAIDEAHCVSMWGHDFRPEYAQLSTLCQQFPGIPVMALTATADPATREEIRERLALGDCEVLVASFERPNIHLEAHPATQRMPQIERYLRAHPGQAGIIYCLSRASTEDTARRLREKGFRAQHYHAGMAAHERKAVQEAFQRDTLDIVCATIAFGMGIDKPNIRWVIHFNLPKNLESYYQEIGRAGRDGDPAEAVLFAGYNDVRTYLDFIQNGDGSDAYKQVQRDKLFRMWEFAQTQSCRMNAILAYFGEHRAEPCGHCDRCLNPPVGFDGTELAQKALSAVYWMSQEASTTTLIEVLRGTHSPTVIEQGFDRIKTFGLGREVSWKHWQSYVSQLVLQGLLSIDYHRGGRLSLTPLSRDVLKGQRAVPLHEPRDPESRESRRSKSSAPPVATTHDESLYDSLVQLRKQICRESGDVPAFTVFSNASLKDMAQRQPTTLDAFAEVSGVGRRKLEQYGERFTRHIADFLSNSPAS